MTTFGKLLLSLIFVSSGVMKLIDLSAFASSVASFKLFPEWSIPIIVSTVPCLEILAGILLHTPWLSGASALTITVLCIGFASLYGAALVLGITPDCGCFGDNPLLRADPPEGLARAIGLAALGVIIWVGPNLAMGKKYLVF